MPLPKLYYNSKADALEKAKDFVEEKFPGAKITNFSHCAEGELQEENERCDEQWSWETEYSPERNGYANFLINAIRLES